MNPGVALTNRFLGTTETPTLEAHNIIQAHKDTTVWFLFWNEKRGETGKPAAENSTEEYDEQIRNATTRDGTYKH
jgi:hypothetical protein